MISGINPISYNDYPKEVSYVIFLGGCNFRCPFCHNSTIVDKKTETIHLSDVIESLKKREKFIKAVVVTGGEPTIYGNKLISLLTIIKNLGFKVKLDTNGTNPKLLERIIAEDIVDYIAMDLKNIFSKYNCTTDSMVDIEKIKESINIIENSSVEYEFRTTINKTNHTIADIEQIVTYISDKNRYYIQNYQYSSEQIVKKDFGKFTAEELKQIKDTIDINVKI